MAFLAPEALELGEVALPELESLGSKYGGRLADYVARKFHPSTVNKMVQVRQLMSSFSHHQDANLYAGGRDQARTFLNRYSDHPTKVSVAQNIAPLLLNTLSQGLVQQSSSPGPVSSDGFA